ncbi:hypothetical protein AGDE_11032 [Angomonas deanei]|nr:hypothetical protein AGDE_11032 [Angomonas deanei]|eukprot:EPY26907.1 hypothetical protein AGDE_11032 [Angomonas deanei]
MLLRRKVLGCTFVTSQTYQTRQTNTGKSGDKVEDSDDPAVVLRRLQQDIRERSNVAREAVPPPPPRRSGKTDFFSKPGTLEGKDAAAEAAKKKTSNQFLRKLSVMEEEAQSPTFPTYDAAAERRRRTVEKKIKEEREKLVVFRDVGMDLDKPILSRDVFLVLKYFRYGIEFAIDNELERMLRYFNEHAVNELKIIQDSKLMRGPPTLSRKKSVQVASSNSSRRDSLTPPLATGEGRGFQVLSHFPTVRGCLLQQFATPPSPSVVNTCKEVLQPPTPAQSFFSPASLKFRESPAAYDIADESQFSTLSPSAFRRPAVVIFSQLGQKFGSRADQEWRELAYKTICPTVLPYIRTKEPENEGTVPKTVKEPHQRKPIDVISLRSVDIYKYKWCTAFTFVALPTLLI